MAGALEPGNTYRYTEDMGQTSEATGIRSNCVRTFPRLGETSSTNSRNNGDDFSNSESPANEHATTDLDYGIQEHNNPSTVKIRQLAIKNARLTEKNERLQVQLIESNTNMSGIEAECSQMHTKLEESNKKVERLENENQSYVNENAALRNELKNATEVHQIAAKKYTAATNMASQRQKEKEIIQKELSGKEAECCQMHTKLEELNEKSESLEVENAALRNELKNATEVHQTVAKKYTDATNMVSQRQKEKEMIQKELSTKLEESNEKSESLEVENATLRNELKRATDMHQDVAKKYADATNMVSQLQKEKKEIQKELASKQAEFSQMHTKLEESNEKIERLENENQSYVNEIGVLCDMVKSGRDIIKEFQENISTEDGHLRQMQTELTEAQEKIHTLENERPSSGDRVSIEGADSVDYKNCLINKPINIQVPHPGLHRL